MKYLLVVTTILLFAWSTIAQVAPPIDYDVEFDRVCLVDSIAPDTVTLFYRYTQSNNPGGFTKDMTFDLSGAYTVNGTLISCTEYFGGTSSDALSASRGVERVGDDFRLGNTIPTTETITVSMSDLSFLNFGYLVQNRLGSANDYALSLAGSGGKLALTGSSVQGEEARLEVDDLAASLRYGLQVSTFSSYAQGVSLILQDSVIRLPDAPPGPNDRIMILDTPSQAIWAPYSSLPSGNVSGKNITVLIYGNSLEIGSDTTFLSGGHLLNDRLYACDYRRDSVGLWVVDTTFNGGAPLNGPPQEIGLADGFGIDRKPRNLIPAFPAYHQYLIRHPYDTIYALVVGRGGKSFTDSLAFSPYIDSLRAIVEEAATIDPIYERFDYVSFGGGPGEDTTLSTALLTIQDLLEDTLGVTDDATTFFVQDAPGVYADWNSERLYMARTYDQWITAESYSDTLYGSLDGVHPTVQDVQIQGLTRYKSIFEGWGKMGTQDISGGGGDCDCPAYEVRGGDIVGDTTVQYVEFLRDTIDAGDFTAASRELYSNLMFLQINNASNVEFFNFRIRVNDGTSTQVLAETTDDIRPGGGEDGVFAFQTWITSDPDASNDIAGTFTMAFETQPAGSGELVTVDDKTDQMIILWEYITDNDDGDSIEVINSFARVE